MPRQLVIKQDKACPTPVGAFLREEAHSIVHETNRKRKARLCVLQNQPVTRRHPVSSASGQPLKACRLCMNY